MISHSFRDVDDAMESFSVRLSTSGYSITGPERLRVMHTLESLPPQDIRRAIAQHSAAIDAATQQALPGGNSATRAAASLRGLVERSAR